ncbi:hypothetical protein KD4_04850 [Yersinia pseudotuberculosis]|uniref:hypothetical protein n=1 Tax=Yersinia pseudotuberculosis TaxID=633 RepID=UPI0038B5C0B0
MNDKKEFNLPKDINSRDNILKWHDYINEKSMEAASGYFNNNDIESLPLDERISLAHKIDSGEINPLNGFDEPPDNNDFLLKAAHLLRLAGLSNTANELLIYVYRNSLNNILEPKIMMSVISNEVKIEISAINRKNASGTKNKYHDEALNIMSNTWAKYPLASKNRMKEKLIEHFGKDRSGKNKISDSSIKRWIKAHNLGPLREVRPPIDFSLVIGS